MVRNTRLVVLRLPIKVQTRLFNLFLPLSRTKKCFSANFANNFAKTQKNYRHRLNPQEKLILIGAVRQETQNTRHNTDWQKNLNVLTAAEFFSFSNLSHKFNWTENGDLMVRFHQIWIHWPGIYDYCTLFGLFALVKRCQGPLLRPFAERRFFRVGGMTID